MCAKISTDYDITNVDGKSLVSEINWTNEHGDNCRATLNPDNTGSYIYESKLDDDDEPKMAPNPMSLADCVLASNVHLGLIPPQNFDPIVCDNSH